MRCEEFETRLNELLDLRKAPDQDLRLYAHAADCAACGRALAGHRQVLACLADSSPPEAPSDLAERVVSRLRPSKKMRQAGPIVVAIVAIAAVLLVTLMPVGWALMNPGPGAPTVQGDGAAPRNDGPRRGGPGLAIGRPGGGRNVARSPQRYRELIASLQQQWERMPLATIDSVDNVPGLRTLAHSVTLAFELLRAAFIGPRPGGLQTG